MPGAVEYLRTYGRVRYRVEKFQRLAGGQVDGGVDASARGAADRERASERGVAAVLAAVFERRQPARDRWQDGRAEVCSSMDS
jgi:hypothetical protein